jgi:hypothetical protein
MTNLCYSLNLLFAFDTETRRGNVLVNGSIPTFLRNQTGILAKRATLRPGQQVSTKQSPDDFCSMIYLGKNCTSFIAYAYAKSMSPRDISSTPIR